MIIGILVPITISLGAFLMVWALRYLQNKENMALIERGINPKEIRPSRERDPSAVLKNAMMFIGAGLGLLLAVIITQMFHFEEGPETAIYFALIAVFGGMGMLGAYLFDRKNKLED
ncbi:MAG: hypothetical protein KGS48_05450 [Bacteroidetes bacterium]|nr:hypothetical protein [Bacteroidota bacterium]